MSNNNEDVLMQFKKNHENLLFPDTQKSVGESRVVIGEILSFLLTCNYILNYNNHNIIKLTIHKAEKIYMHYCRQIVKEMIYKEF